jgi:hypothetical protein
MTFQRYAHEASGAWSIQPCHLVCELYNASYDLTLTFSETNQTITKNSVQLLNEVDYPTVDPNKISDLVQHSYSAYFGAFTDQLIGSIGIYNDTTLSNSSSPSLFSEIKTQLEHTSLLGASDLDYFFSQNHALYANSTSYTNSDQRLEDIRLAQNQTLEFLIPELVFNTTVSFMTSDLLS